MWRMHCRGSREKLVPQIPTQSQVASRGPFFDLGTRGWGQCSWLVSPCPKEGLLPLIVPGSGMVLVWVERCSLSDGLLYGLH